MPRLIRFERGTKVWFYDGRIIYSAYVNKIIKNVPVNVIIVGIGIDKNDNEINEDLNVFDIFLKNQRLNVYLNALKKLNLKPKISEVFVDDTNNFNITPAKLSDKYFLSNSFLKGYREISDIIIAGQYIYDHEWVKLRNLNSNRMPKPLVNWNKLSKLSSNISEKDIESWTMDDFLNEHDRIFYNSHPGYQHHDKFSNIYSRQLHHLNPSDFTEDQLIESGINKIFHRKRLLKLQKKLYYSTGSKKKKSKRKSEKKSKNKKSKKKKHFTK